MIKIVLNPYTDYVCALADEVAAARELPLGGLAVLDRAEPKQDAPLVLLFSPHPDDECITGLLPLRLMREAGMRIVNVPATHGSCMERQIERHAEMRAACAFLGWHLIECLSDGDFRMSDGRRMAGGTDADTVDLRPLEILDVTKILGQLQPAIIFFPHAADWNSRHVATHAVVLEALKRMPEAFCCTVVETEYWGAMDAPNLMVEGDVTMVADLVAATAFHRGEVKRNPYHLWLPAWMMDNVRRGSERVGGQGHAAPEWNFATLYHVKRWSQGRMESIQIQDPFLSVSRSPQSALFSQIP